MKEEHTEHRLEPSINKYKHIIYSQMSILDHARKTKMVKIESLILVWISPEMITVSPHIYVAHSFSGPDSFSTHLQAAHSSGQSDSTQPQSASMILPKFAPTKN